MTVAHSIYEYVSFAVPDVSYTLDIVPQNTLTEQPEIEQIILLADDDSEQTLSFSDSHSYTFILQWDNLSDADAAIIWDCWLTNSNGFQYTFRWYNPLDEHTYVVQFETDIERLFRSGPGSGNSSLKNRGISKIKLKVKGRVS